MGVYGRKFYAIVINFYFAFVIIKQINSTVWINFEMRDNNDLYSTYYIHSKN